MISTFYLSWWQIAAQYCTITLSTLLRKPYKCHSAEVYALRDSAAPESSRRENMCAGPGLALTLYLGHWHLDSDHAPMLTTQGCLVLPGAMQNGSFPSEFCAAFSKANYEQEQPLEVCVAPWPGQITHGMVQLYSYHRMSLGGTMGRWDQREKSDPTSTRSRQTLVRGNGSPGVILQTRTEEFHELYWLSSKLHYRS